MPATRKTRARAPKRPMVADLAGYPLPAAIEIAQTLLETTESYPGAVDAANAALTEVEDWARAHHIEQISDVTGVHAEHLLLDLTGATSLQPADPETADALHLRRNTLSMLRLAVLLARPSAITRRSDRPGQDTIAAGLPDIGPRTGYRLRPLRDDEIALTRMLTALDLNEDAPLVPIHNYVLSEAGLAPMEITAAENANILWGEGGPTRIILAKGRFVRRHENTDKKPVQRSVPFDAWAQHTLGITLPAHERSGRKYLAYTGASPDTPAACASTSPTLKRFLRRAGITGPDVSTGSVALWRPDHVLQEQRDLAAAAYVAGTGKALLLKNLHYTVDEINVHRGVATLIPLDTRPAVYVPAREVCGINSYADDEAKPGTLRRVA